ncbi:MAG TPA: lytic murein transglycosylase, partial [Rhizomicrobium sp.]|nr:lytic murein transglycosylase [Rhizomicrobium sp.]
MGKVLARLAAAVVGLALMAAAPLSPQDQKFQDFVRDFRAVALAQGIKPTTYDLAMANIARNPRIETLNLNQPEFSRAVWSYLDSAVSDKRVADGRAGLNANLQTLNAIETKYGVPKEVLVSIWGNESDFGHGHEPFNMFEALATLAYDGPRADYAKPELIAALKMMQQQHYTPQQMTASWAGAFGQTQFTPTTFLAHAADGDGDGVIDLWHSTADALASTANVLADAGWERGNVWGYEVALPKDFAYELADPDQAKAIAEWKKLGVRTIAGNALPASEAPGAVFLPAGARGPAFMVFDNFKVVLKYNNATSYALAVCLLADRIKGAGPVVASWPRDEQTLTRDERVAFQTGLAKLGYDIGTIDGVLGRKARAATRLWQKAHALPADGFP